MKKHLFLLVIILLHFLPGNAQTPAPPASKGKSIEILHADFTDQNQNEIPGALILTGNIEAQQDSMYIYCNKAYFFPNDNYLKLFGNVHIIQNDTLQLNSNYAEYNGKEGIAFASGNVLMTSPDSSLKSEKVYYDKVNGVAYYNDHATIVNKLNTLKSKAGKYYTAEQKYEFRTQVIITNPDTEIKSEHLDYYEIPGHAYLFGPSTIKNKENFIYTENGFYDTRLDIGKLIKNSHIISDNKRIEGDDMFYDKNKSYSRAIHNVKVTDTVNNMIMTSHFAELFKDRDSIYVTDKPLVRMLTENDTTYFHAKRIIVTGPDKERVLTGYHNARLFRTPDMSGKADSLHYDQKIGLAQLIGNPVLFRGESQMTGKLIHLINNPVTEKLDSLKVLTDAFLIEKDSLGTGYNQAKGINLYGKFRDNKLYEVDLVQNAEMIYYVYDEDDELTGIDKSICSRIHLELEDNQITSATRFVNPEGELYPPAEYPESARLFPGFNWRGDEKIMRREDIFPPEENDIGEKAEVDSEKQQKEAEKPMEASDATKNFIRKTKPANVIKNGK